MNFIGANSLLQFGGVDLDPKVRNHSIKGGDLTAEVQVLLVNNGNWCNAMSVKKCRCVGSYMLYLVLPIYILYCDLALVCVHIGDDDKRGGHKFLRLLHIARI